MLPGPPGVPCTLVAAIPETSRIHAFSSCDVAHAYVGGYVPLLGYPSSRTFDGHLCLAFGRVSGAECMSTNFRAEFAYPYELTVIDGTSRLARAFADRYAVHTRAESRLAA